MRKMVCLLVVIVVASGFAASALPGYPYPSVWGTVVSVIDGNQIVIEIVGASDPAWIVGSEETVRYIGSCADPTTATVCGAIATQVNYQMVFGRLVYLEFDEQLRDVDGAVLAYVYLDGGGFSMVNAALVALGLAKATDVAPNQRYSQVFLGLEQAASQLGLGCLATQH